MARSAKSLNKKPIHHRAMRYALFDSQAHMLRAFARFSGLWIFSFVIMQSFFLQLALSPKNRIEIFPVELILPGIVDCLVSFVITVIIYAVRRPGTYGAKMITTLMVTLFCIDYDVRLQAVSGTVQALVPILPKGEGRMAVTSFVFMLLVLGLSVLMGQLTESFQRKNPSLSNTNIVVSLCLLVGVIATGPAVNLVKTLPVLIRESHPQAPSLSQPLAKAADSKKPDIYYIVLDRYTNNQVLSEQLGYDNSHFSDYLKENGFDVNKDAYSNYPYTAISISSTMSANYTNQSAAPFVRSTLQSRILYHNLIRDSVVAKALKSRGYKYITLGSSYGATSKQPLSDTHYSAEESLRAFGATKHLREIEKVWIHNGPLYRYLVSDGVISLLPAKLVHKDPPSVTQDHLTTLENIAAEDSGGGRFVFAHLLIPHEPFYFNADGSLNIHQSEDNYGKPVAQKYTDQITYINKRIETIVATIMRKSSGTAVIILNADEGEYPQTISDPSLTNGLADNMTLWPINALKLKYGILQAVYIPRATQNDLDNLSSVNVFRIILNRYADYDLGYLPNCNFALSAGREQEYVYSDISEKMRGKPVPECKSYSTN